MQPHRNHFVLVSAPRSGSNHLLSLTGQHPRAHCFYELFHTKPQERTDFFGETYRDEEDGGAFADRVYRWEYPKAIRAVGFKLFAEQASTGPSQSVWTYLAGRPEIKVIDLVRENHLEAYVSKEVAMRTKRWVQYRSSMTAVECPPFEVVPERFEGYVVKLRERRLSALERLRGNPTLSVTYEALSERQTAVMKRVFRFLGLARYPAVWRLSDHLVKQQRVPLAQQVSNYDALEQRFSGTEFARFFSHGSRSRD